MSVGTTACVAHGPGDLRIETVSAPQPGRGEIEVAVELGGICGSDLHYWRHGRVGDFTLREPMVLGHEIVGRVVHVGGDQAETPGPAPGEGDLVIVHPATVCGACPPCRSGRRNLCERVRYLGSAALFPHVQGGLRGRIVVPAAQVHAVPDGLAPERAVLAEPLAVALHAVHRAGDVLGRNILITGAGPIGVLCAAVATAAGAASVTVTDLVPQALDVARSVGATSTLVIGEDSAPAADSADVVIEASGAPPALDTALTAARRGAVVVLLGLLPPGQVPIAGNRAVTREIDLRGSFRFDAEFGEALRLLAGGLPLGEVVTAILPLGEAADAFVLAADRTRACKVLLDVRS